MNRLARLAGLLTEAKAFGTRPVLKIDLRSLEARAYSIVHKRQYPEIVAHQTGIALKQLQALKRRLRVALVREVKAWKKGSIKQSVLLKRSKEFIERAYREAYLQGLKSQGHGMLRGLRGTKLSPTNVLTPHDVAWIRSAVSEEMTYWTRFMRSMEDDTEEIEKAVLDARKRPVEPRSPNEPRDGITRQQQRRLDLYVATVDGVFNSGKVQGSPDTVLIDWVLGESEHCPECIYLAKHSPYTKQTLPCTPRDGSTRCLSNCKCQLSLLTKPSDSEYHSLNRRGRKVNHLQKLRMSRTLRRGLPEVAKLLMQRETNERTRKASKLVRPAGIAGRRHVGRRERF